MNGQVYVCSCFYSHNIYIKEYNIHVIYDDDQQFFRQYGMILHERGCRSEDQELQVIEKINQEIKRRQKLGQMSHERKELIAQKYTPLHKHVYSLEREYFQDNFLQLVGYCSAPDANIDGALKYMSPGCADRAYSIATFKPQFCEQLVEELENFENSDLPKGRPNTMNNYGVLLNELGFDEHFMNIFRTDYLQPIARLLYPECFGKALDSHKAFIVKYKIGQDLDLKCHFDNAEVTFNINLGKDFTGGDLIFSGMKNHDDSDAGGHFAHQPGVGLLHRGQHLHQAMPITGGERFNLIMWLRASNVRNELCPMCDGKPVLVRTRGEGDGFTKDNCDENEVQVCAAC